MRSILGTILLLLAINPLFGQGLINKGSDIYISAGTYLIINDSGGNYTNDSLNSNLGKITLNGTIKLAGNWINNVFQNDVLKHSSTGTVHFKGDTIQSITGANKVTFFNLKIDSNAHVDVQPGLLVKILDSFHNNGRFILLSDTAKTAELIDAGVLTKYSGNGKMVMERFIAPNVWHYVSSPLTESTSHPSIFSGFSLFKYDEPTFSWLPLAPNEKLKNLHGYDVKLNSITGGKAYFDGDYFTGADTINLSYQFDGWNLVGNPYPVTIDWDAVPGWVKTNLSGGIYIWDPFFGPGGNFRYYINGGGVANTMNQYIAPTQGFWVECTTLPCALGINNQAKTDNRKGIFRNSNGFGDIVVLQLENDEEVLIDQSSVRFVDQATSNYDYNLDVRKMSHPDDAGSLLYSLSGNSRMLAINSLPYPVDNISVPLILKIREYENYNIRFDLSNYFFSKSVFLEDKKNGEFVEIYDGYTYYFNEETGDHENRFILHFGRKTSDITDIDHISRPFVQHTGHSVIVRNLEQAAIKLYNTEGKLILSRNNVSGNFEFNNMDYSKGIYFIHIFSENYKCTEKIIIN